MGSEVLQQQINWFLALSYLKAGQKEEAALLLEQITINENYFKRMEAVQLLNYMQE